jgi:hypothetical protein
MRLALTAIFLASTAMLGGCFDPDHERYLRRSDTITLGAGDAVAHNKAVQVIDPWPAWAGYDRIDMDGQRAYLAVKRYQQDKVKEPATTELEPFSGGVIGVTPGGTGGGGQ